MKRLAKRSIILLLILFGVERAAVYFKAPFVAKIVYGVATVVAYALSLSSSASMHAGYNERLSKQKRGPPVIGPFPD